MLTKDGLMKLFWMPLKCLLVAKKPANVLLDVEATHNFIQLQQDKKRILYETQEKKEDKCRWMQKIIHKVAKKSNQSSVHLYYFVMSKVTQSVTFRLKRYLEFLIDQKQYK